MLYQQWKLHLRKVWHILQTSGEDNRHSHNSWRFFRPAVYESWRCWENIHALPNDCDQHQIQDLQCAWPSQIGRKISHCYIFFDVVSDMNHLSYDIMFLSVWQWLHWVQKSNPGPVSVSRCTDWHLASKTSNCKAIWVILLIEHLNDWPIHYSSWPVLRKYIPPTLKWNLFTAPTDWASPWPVVQFWEWCGQTNGPQPEVYGSSATVRIWPWVCTQMLPKREGQSKLFSSDPCKFLIEWLANCSALIHI